LFTFYQISAEPFAALKLAATHPKKSSKITQSETTNESCAQKPEILDFLKNNGKLASYIGESIA